MNSNDSKLHNETPKDSKIWPLLSSVFQYLNIEDNEEHDNKNNKNNDDIDNKMEDNTNNQEYIPMLPIHNDPIQFLKNQQNLLLYDKLPNLIQLHSKYLQSGDNHLLNTRKEILNSISELDKSLDALNEIYLSEKNSKSNKYNLFNNWIVKKSNLNDKIIDIKNNSDEGKTLKSLNSKSIKISDKIIKLENELKLLKLQKKLINHQVLETQSLLDIKLNNLNNDLDSLINNENIEINLLFKENQINSINLSDVEVTENLKNQISSIDNLINNSKNLKLKFSQSKIYLSDIFDTLNKMEISIKNLINESKSDKLGPLLLSNRSYLLERLNQIKLLQFNDIEIIILNELIAIEKALSILNIDLPIINSNDDINILNISNDSTDYYTNSNSFDNLSIISNKQSLQFNNKISVSPPKAQLFTTTASTNISKFTDDSNNFNNRTSKYDNLIKGIKLSKGDKVE